MVENILLNESFYLSIELRLFWGIAFLYLISFLLYLFHLFMPRRDFGRLATNLIILNALFHTLLIALRWFEGGRPPYQTLYEALSWFAWSSVITFIIVQRIFKNVHVPGLVVSALAGAACFYALFTRDPAIEPLPPALQSQWFIWHVILAFLSYAIFVVSCAIEMSFLLFKSCKDEKLIQYGIDRPSCEKFHRLSYKLVLLGFPLLTFGIISGAAWADQAWGRFWGWDPKETWSLITWAVFTLYLHAMTIPSWRGLPASLLNIFGFICMMMTFIGVNWLAKLLGIPSLHVYAI